MTSISASLRPGNIPTDQSVYPTQLMANNLPHVSKPSVPPSALVRKWAGALRQTNPSSSQTGQPLRTVPFLVNSPTIRRLPLGNPLLRVFPPGTTMFTNNNVPQLRQSGPAQDGPAELFGRALNPERMQRYNELSDPQKQVARGLLAAALEAAQKEPWDEGRLNVNDIPEAVVQVLKYAQQSPKSPPKANRIPAKLPTAQVPTRTPLPTAQVPTGMPLPTAQVPTGMPLPAPRGVLQKNGELPPLNQLLTNSQGRRWQEPTLNQTEAQRLQQGQPTLVLSGRDLRNVPDLRDRIIELQRSVKAGSIRIDFQNADLSGLNLQGLDLSRANFKGATLVDTQLQGSNLVGVNATGANFERANLSGAALSNSNFDKTNMRQADMTGSNLNDASFSRADLTGARINRTEMYRVDLSGANLTMVQAQEAYLTRANLNDANLTRGDFSSANFAFAQVQRAQVGGASFQGANFHEIDLTGTNTSFANLRDIKNASPEISPKTAVQASGVQTQPSTATEPSRVPDLDKLKAQAKLEVTPEFLARAKALGLGDYQGTGAVVLVRHGQSEGNIIPGGFFAGSGPNVPLTKRGRQDAVDLVPEMRKVMPQVDRVLVSPVDRAIQTALLSTDGAGGPPFQIVDEFSERRIGGYFGNNKPVGNMRVTSNGIPTGVGHDGRPAFNINPLGPDYVPPNDPNAIGLPTNNLAAEGRTESWNGMYDRVKRGWDQNVAPKLAAGETVGIFSHQFTMANFTTDLYQPNALNPTMPKPDPVTIGHNIPNTAPQYWVIHVFKDAKGNYVSIPAIAGQGSLKN